MDQQVCTQELNEALSRQSLRGELRLPVQGMACAGCSARLEKKLGTLQGVTAAGVNFASETATLAFVSEEIGAGELVAAVEEAGYSVPLPVQRMKIQGMSCASCAARLERALAEAPGIVSAQVNFASELATVKAGLGVSLAELIRVVAEAGYSADPSESDDSNEAEEAELAHAKSELRILVGAAVLTLPLLIPMLIHPMGIVLTIPGWLQLLLAAPVQLVAGARFYRGAWAALRAKTANMDTLVALGTSSAFGLSLALLQSGGGLYFESSAAVITFVLFGKWLESRAKSSTRRAIAALMDLRPVMARLRTKNGEQEVYASTVLRGDVVVVRPGEQVPVDGRIMEGASYLNESLINGESLPVSKEKEDAVIGGSVNGEGLLVIEATNVAEESMLSRIVAPVQDAQASKAPIQRTVDKISAVFVPVVLAITLLTLGGWLLAGAGSSHSLINAVSVLVIACPCALGLATPAALMVGTGAAARAGILIKDAEALEVAQRVNTVVFDKTGTLTEGRPRVQELLADDEEELLSLVAASQVGSEHPLAEAIRVAAKERKLTLSEASHFQATAGRGVEAEVDGVLMRVGSPRWMKELGLSVERFSQRAAVLETQGMTVMWAARGETVLGGIALGDTLRGTAKVAIERLSSEGVETVLLTGDNRAAAEYVGAELGVDLILSEVLPDEKAAEVEALRRKGRVVAMVGDGVNDAPALSAADVGFAMGSGTDVAMHSAGVTLMRSEPNLVCDAISVSRATSRKIMQNLFWAFAYNSVGIPLAALGYLSPMVAGAAMALSSVSVLTNALLLRSWEPRP